ncbi:hypothetical protein J3Q64DRAFT_1774013 [Phycomyces blakesleeanus]|uniref:Uncharacterized protein n=1 Tax=Phycomyces blakesleeanus TaxID=4837 RepID=A0ABR3AJV2_PHYBL
MISSRAASIVLVPVAAAAAYATYVRNTVQPSLAYSSIMSQGSNPSAQEQWRKVNKGLGLVDVGRSCGGV